MNLIQTVEILCPYCGQLNQCAVEFSTDLQEYVEDCTVCCRPMTLMVSREENGHITVDVRSDND